MQNKKHHSTGNFITFKCIQSIFMYHLPKLRHCILFERWVFCLQKLNFSLVHTRTNSDVTVITKITQLKIIVQSSILFFTYFSLQLVFTEIVVTVRFNLAFFHYHGSDSPPPTTCSWDSRLSRVRTRVCKFSACPKFFIYVVNLELICLEYCDLW